MGLMMARKAAGLTQQALGQRVGVHQSVVCKWELGDRTPDMHLYQGIADALGLSLHDMTSMLASAPK
ncbi:helix-turn-helix transcriptional regulator [Amycolatopsis sp. H20-H5]|uniref:helix-turn-helix transcriptional regulator n=1 Tax=Amycolatopsis sp. H20-H5 TaxID=3046309 RepID=UPI002DBD51F4|nr:helix-turn-helix transcriptional regulator [Amycolatopsis sp. H20-H5]MEC3978618.1 helix-turn-helix transcriptional regulator [Amycolatopsis sp. H20-H5]